MIEFEQVSTMTKVMVSDDRHQTIFTYNKQNEALDIYCRQIKKDKKYWASIRLNDIKPEFQALFGSIQLLYQYISKNIQEITVSKGQVTLNISFFKQKKNMQFSLNRMIMFSHEQHRKLSTKIRNLQFQNDLLQTKIKCDGLKKLTLPLIFQNLNLASFSFTNSDRIRPISNNVPYGVFLNGDAHFLPLGGLWHFQLIVSQFINKSKLFPTTVNLFPIEKQNSPRLEVGVRFQDNSKITTIFSSINDHVSLMEEEQKIGDDIIQADQYICEHDILHIYMNLDLCEMQIYRNYKVAKIINWKHMKGKRILLYLRPFKMQLRTDLFMEEKEVKWTMVHDVEQKQQEQQIQQ